jgi:hypothetical protein
MGVFTAATPTQEDSGLAVRPAVQVPNPDLVQWQRGLLPFMTYFIVMMAVAFFFFSGLHIYQVTRFIQGGQEQSIRALIQGELDKPAGQALTPDDARENSLLLLEADALDKRYHQAGGLLISRIWSRQLAFITGMVMAFVGAVFILGKMSEGVSEVSGGVSEWKVAISSASPGILLSFFGTVLLVSSLFVPATLDVSDGPAYISALRMKPAATSETAPGAQKPITPLDLNDLEKLGNSKQAPRPQ